MRPPTDVSKHATWLSPWANKSLSFALVILSTSRRAVIQFHIPRWIFFLLSACHSDASSWQTGDWIISPPLALLECPQILIALNGIRLGWLYDFEYGCYFRHWIVSFRLSIAMPKARLMSPERPSIFTGGVDKTTSTIMIWHPCKLLLDILPSDRFVNSSYSPGHYRRIQRMLRVFHILTGVEQVNMQVNGDDGSWKQSKEFHRSRPGPRQTFYDIGAQFACLKRQMPMHFKEEGGYLTWNAGFIRCRRWTDTTVLDLSV
jgi:hypothetical protein